LGRADIALIVLDARAPEAGRAELSAAVAGVPTRLWLLNKSDLLVDAPSPPAGMEDALPISARSGAGLERLHERLRALWQGSTAEAAEGTFTARARHVDALRRAAGELQAARQALGTESLDLAAEALRAGHEALGEITGRVAPDDLLGHIFSSFCIGK
ncbi:MAG: tRNA uridine-5-carboxymethylaminomethyl(34) synthesis GTPase MnmE, partial [Luteimonas sp.]|nr:tRNA uridine-5-carboxymethylaminomethyl(34) synthesis GTPase MnmE [Luteimonas sp.]